MYIVLGLYPLMILSVTKPGTSPYMNVASYALSIFEKGLASKVYLAGFDGYEERNSAHSEVQNHKLFCKIKNYFNH